MEIIGTGKWVLQQEQRIKQKLVEPGSVDIPPMKRLRPLGANMTHGVRIVINPTRYRILQLKFKGRLQD